MFDSRRCDARSTPVHTGDHCSDRRSQEQADHDGPLEGATSAIGIDAEDDFDPLRREQGDDREDRGHYRDAQIDTEPNPGKAPRTQTHAHPLCAAEISTSPRGVFRWSDAAVILGAVAFQAAARTRSRRRYRHDWQHETNVVPSVIRSSGVDAFATGRTAPTRRATTTW